tara:strand:+ start:3106 stop:3282 length:177 start_codon:yes stop_codon:yes gene_type:complete
MVFLCRNFLSILTLFDSGDEIYPLPVPSDAVLSIVKSALENLHPKMKNTKIANNKNIS